MQVLTRSRHPISRVFHYAYAGIPSLNLVQAFWIMESAGSCQRQWPEVFQLALFPGEICYHSSTSASAFSLWPLCRFFFITGFKQLDYDETWYMLFIFLGVHWASWICGFIVFTHFGNVLPIIASIFFCNRSFISGTSITCVFWPLETAAFFQWCPVMFLSLPLK